MALKASIGDNAGFVSSSKPETRREYFDDRGDVHMVSNAVQHQQPRTHDRYQAAQQR